MGGWSLRWGLLMVEGGEGWMDCVPVPRLLVLANTLTPSWLRCRGGASAASARGSSLETTMGESGNSWETLSAILLSVWVVFRRRRGRSLVPACSMMY